MTDRFYKLTHRIAARDDLQPTDKILYSVIVDFIGSNPTGWPGKKCLMTRTSLAGQTICDAIRRLEKLGLLAVDRRGPGKSNHYRIVSPAAEPCRDVDQSKSWIAGGPGGGPVQNTDQCINQTVGCPASGPDVVQPMDTNHTDLLNQRENTPENQAKIKFQTAKEKTELPTEFLIWFETEVLTRWDKFPVSSATLDDWHSLYKTFGNRIITAAIQRHRQDTPRKQWTPELAAVKSLAQKIRGTGDGRSPQRIEQLRQEKEIASKIDLDKTVGERGGKFADYLKRKKAQTAPGLDPSLGPSQGNSDAVTARGKKETEC